MEGSEERAGGKARAGAAYQENPPSDHSTIGLDGQATPHPAAHISEVLEVKNNEHVLSLYL